ncbi:40S ribosomal protein SA [Glycine soja]|uniref:40S ribosomal protein SA n=1 Tax=Glycine soja TaxID=3848 RepID=A0A0B2PKI6_GLYSO|nr:40S ribosomal protein SA [Glycine soja]
MATATNVAAAPPRQLSQKEADIQMMLAANVHLGSKNCDFQMEHYIFKRRNDARSQTTNNVNCVFCSCVILFHVVFAHWPVFHVMDSNGKKFMQDDVADRIQQVVDLQNQSQTIFTLTIFMLVHFLCNLALKLG